MGCRATTDRIPLRRIEYTRPCVADIMPGRTFSDCEKGCMARRAPTSLPPSTGRAVSSFHEFASNAHSALPHAEKKLVFGQERPLCTRSPRKRPWRALPAARSHEVRRAEVSAEWRGSILRVGFTRPLCAAQRVPVCALGS